MSTDGLLKGALAGAGAALLVMYIAKKKNTGAAKLSQVTENSQVLKDLSDEKLAEIKDSIEDIMAERDAQ